MYPSPEQSKQLRDLGFDQTLAPVFWVWLEAGCWGGWALWLTRDKPDAPCIIYAEPGAKQILSRVGTILKSYSNRRIKIEGHTDNVPIKNSEYGSSLWLSTARATKVLEYLIDKKHLNDKNLEASGRGDVDPVASNGTAAGRAKNRRVEIKIYTDSE